MSPKTPMDAVRRKYGIKGLRRAYVSNLELVLEQVVELLKYVSGKIVITSDHGELLGENRCFTHTPGSMKKCLLEVPWLEIDKCQRDIEPVVNKQNESVVGSEQNQEQSVDEEEITRKLQDLGYF